MTTGDVTPPRFAQPPLVDSAETSVRLRVSSSEPATLHWAISYNNVAAEYRYQLLGFKSSKLSTQQVLDVSSAPDAAAESGLLAGGRAGSAAALRRLQQSAGGNDTVLRETGPIVAWGQWQLDRANEVTDLEITPPCINNTVMCMEHTDSLNPQTEYKVGVICFFFALPHGHLRNDVHEPCTCRCTWCWWMNQEILWMPRKCPWRQRCQIRLSQTCGSARPVQGLLLPPAQTVLRGASFAGTLAQRPLMSRSQRMRVVRFTT